MYKSVWGGFLLVLFFAGTAAAIEGNVVQYQFTEESTIGFDAKSTLHQFSGETNSLLGKFEIDLNNAAASRAGTIQIYAAALDTGNKARDKKMRRHHLEVEKYPLIKYDVLRCIPLKKETGNLGKYSLEGRLSLHGASKIVHVPVTLDQSDPNHLKISGGTYISLSDFNIKRPSVLGLIKMEKEVFVRFNLVAAPAE